MKNHTKPKTPTFNHATEYAPRHPTLDPSLSTPALNPRPSVADWLSTHQAQSSLVKPDKAKNNIFRPSTDPEHQNFRKTERASFIVPDSGRK